MSKDTKIGGVLSLVGGHQKCAIQGVECIGVKYFAPNGPPPLLLVWPPTGDKIAFCAGCSQTGLKILDDMGFEVR